MFNIWNREIQWHDQKASLCGWCRVSKILNVHYILSVTATWICISVERFIWFCLTSLEKDLQNFNTGDLHMIVPLKITCNLHTPLYLSWRRPWHLIIIEWRFRDWLTWCIVARNLLKAVRDTHEGIPQWQSGESHWMSAHPWVTAGHWPWLPLNQPLSDEMEILRLQQTWARRSGPKPGKWIQGFSTNSVLYWGQINLHLESASNIPKQIALAG